MFKRLFSALGAVTLVLALSAGAVAQNTVFLSWPIQTPPGITVAGYNIYRGPCSGYVPSSTDPTVGVCTNEGASAKIGTVGPTIQNFDDQAVTKGASYFYFFRYFCTGTGCGTFTTTESPDSNHVAVRIPNPLPAPTGLQVLKIQVAAIRGVNTDVLASWQDDPNTLVQWSIADANGRLVASGNQASALGSYSVTATAKKQPGPYTLTVCDAAGCATARS